MSNNTESLPEFPISRRRMLLASAAATTGLLGATGTAHAHEVGTIAFCGCSQVTVYGAWLLGRSGDEDEYYQAIVYCDGDIVYRPLTGSQTRQNYDLDDDDTLDGQDCQIIAITGETWPHGEFTICNEHCPANCATKGLEDIELECDDPAEITSGGSRDGIERDQITIQCSGCGREQPGNPGRNNGRPDNSNPNHGHTNRR